MKKNNKTKNKNGLGIAIWYKHIQNTSPDKHQTPEIELHFNLWKFRPIWRCYNRCFLDIGILISNHIDIDEFYIFVPGQHKVWEQDITNITNLLGKKNTAVAVFNEDITPTEGQGFSDLKFESSYIRAWNLGGTDVTATFRESASETSSDSVKGSGTIITICKQAFDRARGGKQTTGPVDKIYFRLRIDFKNLGKVPFFKKITPIDNMFLSGFDTIECVDFKVNEQRNIPSQITFEMKSSVNETPIIKRIDFLLATDAASDFISGHKPFHKCRMLENDLWKDYVIGNLAKHMVIYHWKSLEESTEKPLSEFNCFLKFRVRQSSIISIIRYLIFALTIGALSSYFSTFIPTSKNVDNQNQLNDGSHQNLLSAPMPGKGQ